SRSLSISHASCLSGFGLFVASEEFTESLGCKLLAIGVHSDQYNTAGDEVKDYILTSMLKRVDVAVFEIIKAHIEGNFASGPQEYDLSVDGVGYATSGGFIEDITDTLEDYKAKNVSGEIEVPTTTAPRPWTGAQAALPGQGGRDRRPSGPVLAPGWEEWPPRSNRSA